MSFLLALLAAIGLGALAPHTAGGAAAIKRADFGGPGMVHAAKAAGGGSGVVVTISDVVSGPGMK